MIIDEKNPNASMGPSSMYPPPPPYSAIAASWQRPPTPPLPPPTFTRGPTHRRDSGGDHDAVEVGLGCARHTTPAANVHNSDNVISIGSSSSPNRGSKVYGNLKGKASCRAQAPVRFSTLPSHILLQIVYSTFPQTDGVYEGGETVSKVERQRENLFWMEMSLRLVNRALYVACMHILRSTYLPAYNSLIRPPYSSDPFPAPSSSRNTIFATTHRELSTLDLFIALLAQEDVLLDSSELYMPREEAYKDLFDYNQPRSRLEDLIREEGVKVGVVVVDGSEEETQGQGEAVLATTEGPVVQAPDFVVSEQSRASAPGSNIPPQSSSPTSMSSPIVLQYTEPPTPPSPISPATASETIEPPSPTPPPSASPTKGSFSLSKFVSSYREKASAKVHYRKSLVPSPYPLALPDTPPSPVPCGTGMDVTDVSHSKKHKEKQNRKLLVPSPYPLTHPDTPPPPVTGLDVTDIPHTKKRKEKQITPLPFSSLSVSFSPRAVKLLYDPPPNPLTSTFSFPASADTSQSAFGGSTFGSLSMSGVSHGRWKKRSLVEVSRGREEKLEESASRLVRGLRNVLEEDV